MSFLKKFVEDEILIHEGEVKPEMYKIISGYAAIYLNYGKENEYLLGILSEQQCFGELGLLCKEPSIYTVVAVDDVLVMCIQRNNFDEFIEKNPNNAVNIIKGMARSMVTLRGNIDMLVDELIYEDKQSKYSPEELRQKIYNYARQSIWTGQKVDKKG